MSLPGMHRDRTVTFHPSPDPTFHSSFHRVCMSLCVSEWIRNIYVSFLCLQVCLPVRERFRFYTTAVVTDGDPAWSSVHFEGCKRSDLESTVSSSRALTTVLTRPSFTTSQMALEKQIQRNGIFGSLSALVDPGSWRSLPSPLHYDN